MEYITLNNGIEMPIIGYGTYLTSKKDTKELVLQALNVGYRHIDTAQVILRFLIQNNIIVIPKSTSKNRMKENLDIFDFEMNNEEMNIISNLDENKSYSNWPDSMQIEKS